MDRSSYVSAYAYVYVAAVFTYAYAYDYACAYVLMHQRRKEARGSEGK